MTRYYGGEKVAAGIYFNLEQISFRSLEEEGHLPGTGQDEYRCVPALAILLVGPFVGGLYIIFLPVIGFVMLARLVVGKAVGLAASAAAAWVPVLKPAWQPAMAFLSRGRAAKKAGQRTDSWAEDTRKEVVEDSTSPRDAGAPS